MAKQHLHFLGIAGHAMRGLALSAQELGYMVTGTDEGAVEPGSTWLDKHGLKWWDKPSSDHLSGVDKLIISGGSAPGHVEILTAQKLGIEVLSFAQLIDQLLTNQNRIVISGTHGKTTTTALLTWILQTADLEPSYILGAPTPNLPSTTRIHKSSYAVIEGDEYQASQLDTNSKFAYYHPDYLVITSIEMDHPDFFSSIDAVYRKFSTLIGQMDADDTILYNLTDQDATRLVAPASAHTLSYGEGADYSAKQETFDEAGIKFGLDYKGEKKGDFSVGLYGRHNLQNALAATGLASSLSIPGDVIRQALDSFEGTYRRFTIHSSDYGFRVVDDYAHHPTAVAANIQAVRDHFGGKCVAILQPHTYSRTRALAKDFTEALSLADNAYLLDIEAAREGNQPDEFSSSSLADRKSIQYLPNHKELLAEVLKNVDGQTTVLVMSVSNQNELIKLLTKK